MIFNMYINSGSSFTVPSWSSGSDVEIIEALKRHYDGEINLRNYWNVGDVRTISLSAMSAAYTNESHAAQNVDFYILDKRDLKTFVNPVNGHTAAAFVVGMRFPLNEPGRINSNVVGVTWGSCERRSWCNRTFYDSIPRTIRGIFKNFYTLTATKKNNGTEEWNSDFFTLPAEKEVFGTTNYSSTLEDQLSQFEFYSTAYPYRYGTSVWLRSPYNTSIVSAFATAKSDSSSGSFGPSYENVNKDFYVVVYGAI